MSIQQTKRQSDLEKRLQLIRRQVYGKESESQRILESKNQSTIFPYDSSRFAEHNSRSHPKTTTNDITYLHQDLLKILIFSSTAVGIQLVLFFLTKNGLLNFIR